MGWEGSGKSEGMEARNWNDTRQRGGPIRSGASQGSEEGSCSGLPEVVENNAMGAAGSGRRRTVEATAERHELHHEHRSGSGRDGSLARDGLRGVRPPGRAARDMGTGPGDGAGVGRRSLDSWRFGPSPPGGREVRDEISGIHDREGRAPGVHRSGFQRDQERDDGWSNRPNPKESGRTSERGREGRGLPRRACLKLRGVRNDGGVEVFGSGRASRGRSEWRIRGGDAPGTAGWAGRAWGAPPSSPGDRVGHGDFHRRRKNGGTTENREIRRADPRGHRGRGTLDGSQCQGTDRSSREFPDPRDEQAGIRGASRAAQLDENLDRGEVDGVGFLTVPLEG